MKNKLLSLEINWTKTILQEFWRGNIVELSGSWYFAKLIFNHFAYANAFKPILIVFELLYK